MNVALVGHSGSLRLAVHRRGLNDWYVGGDRLEGGHLRLGGCGGNDGCGDGGRCELGCLNSRRGNYSRRELSSGGGDERLFAAAAGNRSYDIHGSHWMRERCDHAGRRWHGHCGLGKWRRGRHGVGHRQR